MYSTEEESASAVRYPGGAVRFERTIGGKGSAPGKFEEPWGVAVCPCRSLLIVSEREGRRLQVLTLEGVPLQVLPLNSAVAGLCASDKRVWVTDVHAHKVHTVLDVIG